MTVSRPSRARGLKLIIRFKPGITGSRAHRGRVD